MNNDTKLYSPEALRYATALMELDFQKSSLDNLTCIFANTPEFFDILTNPTVDIDIKIRIIDRAIDEQLSKNFLKVLVTNNDCSILFEILTACKHLFMMQERTLHAELTYYIPPDEAQLSAIKKLICKKHHCKDVKLDMKYSEDLLGGFILYVDGVQYDYSISGHLKRLKRNLTGR